MIVVGPVEFSFCWAELIKSLKFVPMNTNEWFVLDPKLSLNELNSLDLKGIKSLLCYRSHLLGFKKMILGQLFESLNDFKVEIKEGWVIIWEFIGPQASFVTLLRIDNWRCYA